MNPCGHVGAYGVPCELPEKHPGRLHEGVLYVGDASTSARVRWGPPTPVDDDLPAGIYWWVRKDDETGMSGTGRVAQVAVFEDGSAVLRWLKHRNSAGVGSTVVYGTVRDLVWIHGHGDKRTGYLERA